MVSDKSKKFKFFLNFSIRYNFVKTDDSYDNIIENLNLVSKITINKWDLKFQKGRIEIFHTFPQLKPHISLMKEDRFEIYANEDCVKINFPAEEFFHIPGPRGITRVASFPDKTSPKPCSQNELKDLQDNLKIVFLSQNGICPNISYDSVSVQFETKRPKELSFDKVKENLNSKNFDYEIGRIELIKKNEENNFRLTFLDKSIVGMFTYNELFSLSVPIAEILEKVIKTLEKIMDEIKNG